MLKLKELDLSMQLGCGDEWERFLCGMVAPRICCNIHLLRVSVCLYVYDIDIHLQYMYLS